MGLPHQQAGAHLEREVDGRAVGHAHLVTTQRQVVPRVVGLRRTRLEEERQVDPGADEDHERVERDLAEQERPVVREDVAERLPEERRGAAPLVDEPDETTDHVPGPVLGFRVRTPHQDGPTGPEKLPPARSSPRGST